MLRLTVFCHVELVETKTEVTKNKVRTLKHYFCKPFINASTNQQSKKCKPQADEFVGENVPACYF